jgi:hypothetical protein
MENMMDLILGLAVMMMAILLAMDFAQTLIIAVSPSYQELNPILGPKPSRTRVWCYFLVVYLLLAASTVAFKEHAEMALTVVLGVLTLAELWVVIRNHYIGVHVYKSW